MLLLLQVGRSFLASQSRTMEVTTIYFKVLLLVLFSVYFFTEHDLPIGQVDSDLSDGLLAGRVKRQNGNFQVSIRGFYEVSEHLHLLLCRSLC